MSNAQKDQLFLLINSLSKAEKRNFRLYATRNQSGKDAKFVQLFDALDKLDDFDEQAVLKKLPAVKKQHLPNLKRHLYRQILTSLRLIHIQKNIDIQIREQIDFARILYGKGMYMQSLRILDRIKQIAIEHHQDLLHLEILEFQKLIEARHVTRSRAVEHKMDVLLGESETRCTVTYYSNLLSNLNIKIHGWYIDRGHARSAAEKDEIKAFLDQHYPEHLHVTTRKETFFERVNLNQIYLWFHYINQDFLRAEEQAKQWVNQFFRNTQMQEKDPDLYMRGLYYLLVFLFINQDKKEHAYYLDQFVEYVEDADSYLNTNSRMVASFYLNLSRINHLLLNGNYKGADKLIPGIEEEIDLYQHHADRYRVLLFYYKFAWIKFALGEFDKAQDYLNEIVLVKNDVLREELYYFARVLQLLCFYENNDYDVMAYNLTSLRRSMGRSHHTDKLLQTTTSFLKKICETPESESLELFQQLGQELDKQKHKPDNQKSLIYLNTPLWVKSRIKGCTISDICETESLTVSGC
ncbi:hypothetical protein [Flavilitoribacter nigricans]|uniref:Tetratricopeptide repeat protein n=1 Tax=Flavilitoribacter nigricans (strain ATCC 23147 / DSM 23189 / NBRC 102662 / NCIMB 1420 / SS-2) TaxID=1122177 RepID=A0A2D0MYU7_FLAN2|nr:hypothetical protein [Flavilitoribacter nigricans]PHN01425.1 hypothetical protein CRP01_37195 [Flavilitoribacter nigricans DSM 23189 = NBRC 102662]